MNRPWTDDEIDALASDRSGDRAFDAVEAVGSDVRSLARMLKRLGRTGDPEVVGAVAMGIARLPWAVPPSKEVGALVLALATQAQALDDGPVLTTAATAAGSAVAAGHLADAVDRVAAADHGELADEVAAARDVLRRDGPHR